MCAGRLCSRQGAVVVLAALLTSFVPSLLFAQIHQASARGDLAAVRSLLDADSSLVDAADEAGDTPLLHAARGGHRPVVQLLLSRGANVAARSRDGATALHAAAARNDTATLRLLLDDRAEPDPRDAGGHTPLHRAAMSDATDAVMLLLERGAALESRDAYERTALLLCARERGQARTLAALMRAGARVDVVDRFGSTPLELAAWRGKSESVDMLLRAGVAVPTQGRAAAVLIDLSASKGLPRLFQALRAAGADVRADPTLLHQAAAGGSPEIVRVLLDAGMRPGGADPFGWTPLHYAARDGRIEVARLLLERGAPMDARTLMGQTALNVAEEMGASDVRALLAAAGADPAPIRFPELRGEYLGQSPPGDVPELFAPGIVSSIWGLHSTAAVSPDGSMIAWSPMVMRPGQLYAGGGVLLSQRKAGRWSAPAWAPFTDDGDVPFFAPDGRRVYFISRRPLPGAAAPPAAGELNPERIWYADRVGNGWGEARPVDAAVNDYPHHWQFSVDAEGTLYFASRVPGNRGAGDLYRARLVDGHWQAPEPLPDAVNTAGDEGMPFIAPDGSYLLFARDYDLWISFPAAGGGWGEARKLPEPINSPAIDICPVVTPDGKYLFFLSQRGGESHAWWVSTAFLARMRGS